MTREEIAALLDEEHEAVMGTLALLARGGDRDDEGTHYLFEMAGVNAYRRHLLATRPDLPVPDHVIAQVRAGIQAIKNVHAQAIAARGGAS